MVLPVRLSTIEFEMLRQFARYILFFVLAWLTGMCSQNGIFVPHRCKFEVPTIPLPYATRLSLEGVYRVVAGNKNLGVDLVCKASRDKLSFFTNIKGIVIILDAAMDADSTLRFAGFWRVSEYIETGEICLAMDKEKGSKFLTHKAGPLGLQLTGSFSSIQARDNAITLEYIRGFSPSAISDSLAIFGHHGVETNGNPPFTENSLEAFRQAEAYGANALEVDVRLTRDNVPVLYHDVDLNYRLVQKQGILANLDQVSWDLLKSSIRLTDGQRIPSVEQALTIAVDSTNLRYVWLDIKGNPNVFKYLEPIVRAAMSRAASKGRKITIISDIPSTEVLAEYYKQPSYADLPLMYELGLDKAIELGCKYWGPRWTEGTLDKEVKRAHRLGIDVYAWTINSEKYVEIYLNAGFDGMITDYPAYAAFHHYIKP